MPNAWSGPIRRLWRISGKMVRSSTQWISGVFLEDGQSPSDGCGGFLACIGKMVRSSTVDFWSVLGRWSGPIRQLWRIAGLVQEDGQAPSDGCGGFLACSGKMVRSHQTAMEDF